MARSEDLDPTRHDARVWEHLDPVRADGRACVMCGQPSGRRGPAVPVGRSVTGSQVFACEVPCLAAIDQAMA